MKKKYLHTILLLAIFSLGHPILIAKDKPLFRIKDKGTEFPVNYKRYGRMTGVGTHKYRYKIRNRKGLAKAMGAGVYPNGTSLGKEPGYRKWKKGAPAHLNHWDYADIGEPQVEFYVWAQARDVGPGTKLFFTAEALARGGHIRQALKAFHAVLVLFPKEPCWSADQSFVWYVAKASLDRIETLLAHHPEIPFTLEGEIWEVENGTDTDLKNDQFKINPGWWVKRKTKKASPLSSLEIINQRGWGKVQLVQYANKHWVMRVEGEPTVVRGLTYLPTEVGTHVADKGANRWMHVDANADGRIDSPYESWLDKNKNNKQDPNEPTRGDFALIQEMGGNTIRLYRNSKALEYDPSEFNKELLREMTNNYGIRAIMGDFLGAYTVGSGATWEEGTDYTDPVQLERMKQLVRDYVKDHREEPYVLMWLLGNENLMQADYTGVNATRTKASVQVEAYLSFVNEVAEMIHQIDPDHPVAVGNLDLTQLKAFATYAPSVDIYGANSYRGSLGFGDLWKEVQANFDRPILITEFGCDAFDSRSEKENEKLQAAYHKNAWNDIQLNLGGNRGIGNSIGGVVFEFLDEWWKSPLGSWEVHDRSKDSPMAFPDGWSSEEWMGLLSQGNGQHSSLLRQPRKVYYLYKDSLWDKYSLRGNR